MIQFSKKQIFLLLVGNCILLGISLSDSDWNLFSDPYVKEGLLPVLFLIMSIYFLIRYVLIIKTKT